MARRACLCCWLAAQQQLTTPTALLSALQGAKGIYKALKEHLGIDYGQTTPVSAGGDHASGAASCLSPIAAPSHASLVRSSCLLCHLASLLLPPLPCNPPARTACSRWARWSAWARASTPP